VKHGKRVWGAAKRGSQSSFVGFYSPKPCRTSQSFFYFRPQPTPNAPEARSFTCSDGGARAPAPLRRTGRKNKNPARWARWSCAQLAPLPPADGFDVASEMCVFGGRSARLIRQKHTLKVTVKSIFAFSIIVLYFVKLKFQYLSRGVYGVPC
jgi:hypothetical protein